MKFINFMIVQLYETEQDFINGIIKEERIEHNDVTNTGAGDFLIQVFAASSYTAAFFIAPYSGPFFITDTINTHGYTEFTSYSEVVRQTLDLTQTTETTSSRVNSSTDTFTITGSGTIDGFIVTTDNTKDGIAGILFSGASISPINVANGNTLTVTWECRLANSL